MCACLRECVCAYMYECVCVISKSRGSLKSTVYQDDMFLCFLHELYRAGLCCAFCYFYKSVLRSLFFLSSFVGIMTCCLKTWIIERLLGMGIGSTLRTGVSRDSSWTLTHSELPVPLPHTSTGHACSLLAAKRQFPSAANTGRANALRD